MTDFSRREFLEVMALGSMAAAAGPASALADKGEVPRRPLGRTGEEVSIVGLGGYHLGKPSEATALRLMHRAIDEGITFFDNCWDYHKGESERRMGKAFAGGRRDKVFLMSKIDGRTREAAKAQLEDSLRRLRTDRIDLMQIHEVIRPEDPNWVFGPRGAIEVLKEAQEAGTIRFIGFTGHKDPRFHLAMIDRAEKDGFRFDAVQLPLNVMDAHYDSFEQQVLPRLVKDGTGVLGMKALGSGILLESGVVKPEACLRYALSLPTSVVITGCEKMRDLDQALKVARGFSPLGKAEKEALLARTRPAARGGTYEKYKVSRQFDGTVQNPHWLSTGHL